MENISLKHPIDDVREPKTFTEQVSPAAPAVQSFEVREAEKKQQESEEVQFSPKESEQMAEDLASGMNKIANVFNTSLSFTVDLGTGRSIIEVVDKESKEVIRQIPPEKALKLMTNMRDVMGMLLDVEI